MDWPIPKGRCNSGHSHATLYYHLHSKCPELCLLIRKTQHLVCRPTTYDAVTRGALDSLYLFSHLNAYMQAGARMLGQDALHRYEVRCVLSALYVTRAR